MFTQQAEQIIYNSVQFPALRKNVTGVLSTGNKYLGTLLTIFGITLAVVDGSGDYHFLYQQGREFYPRSLP